MNDDDSASVLVNGERYPFTSASASYGLKVVCGTTPGPDGVLFSAGNLVGANTPGEANFSYQDLQLKAVNVTSITVTGLKGAGWGFAGASVYRTVPDAVKKAIEQSEPEDAAKEQSEPERDRRK